MDEEGIRYNVCTRSHVQYAQEKWKNNTTTWRRVADWDTDQARKITSRCTRGPPRHAAS